MDTIEKLKVLSEDSQYDLACACGTRDDDRRRMKISTKWKVEVVFLWGVYSRTFHFQPVAEQGFMNVVR